MRAAFIVELDDMLICMPPSDGAAPRLQHFACRHAAAADERR